MQRPGRGTIWDLHLQVLLPAAERCVIRHGPVKPGQAQKALHKPSRLPQSQPEQHLDRQAKLYGRRRKPLWMTRLAARRPEPCHLRVKPHRQRATALQSLTVAGPVRRAEKGDGLARAANLTR